MSNYSEEALKNLLFKSIYIIDVMSNEFAIKNNDKSFRKYHYRNMQQLEAFGLTKEYYDYWFNEKFGKGDEDKDEEVH